MTVEIISLSITTKVWDWAGIKFITPGSAVGLTNCATRPGGSQDVMVLQTHHEK